MSQEFFNFMDIATGIAFILVFGILLLVCPITLIVGGIQSNDHIMKYIGYTLAVLFYVPALILLLMVISDLNL